MSLLLRWVASAAAIAVVAWWLPGIRITGGPETVFVVAGVLAANRISSAVAARGRR